MSLTQNTKNILIRTMKLFDGRRSQPAPGQPANVVQGATTRSVGNIGSARGRQVIGAPYDGRQWRAPGLGTAGDSPRRR